MVRLSIYIPFVWQAKSFFFFFFKSTCVYKLREIERRQRGIQTGDEISNIYIYNLFGVNITARSPLGCRVGTDRTASKCQTGKKKKKNLHQHLSQSAASLSFFANSLPSLQKPSQESSGSSLFCLK